MKTKTPVIAVGAFLFFASCAKLPIYESKTLDKTNSVSTLNISDNYDKKNDIHFGVANDKTDLLVQAVFHDRQSFMKIMRGGIIVNFDPSGKKNKDYQLKVERSGRIQPEASGERSQFQRNGQNRMQNMPMLISSVFNKVTWNQNGKVTVYDRSLEHDPVDVQLVSNSQNELVLNAKVPLVDISVHSNQVLSVGIETGTPSYGGTGGRPSGGGSGEFGGSTGGRMGGSGMRGSGMGGGMRGGGMYGGGRSSGGGASSGMEPVRIWFQVEL